MAAVVHAHGQHASGRRAGVVADLWRPRGRRAERGGGKRAGWTPSPGFNPATEERTLPACRQTMASSRGQRITAVQKVRVDPPKRARAQTRPTRRSRTAPTPPQTPARGTRASAELAQVAYGCQRQPEPPRLHPDHRSIGRSKNASRILTLRHQFEEHPKETERPRHRDKDSAGLRGTHGMPYRRSGRQWPEGPLPSRRPSPGAGGWRPHSLASAAIQFCQTWIVLGTSGRSRSQRT